MPNANHAYQLMTLITTHKLGDKAESIFKKHGLSLQYRFGAEGTASSDMMDVLGLGSVDKCVLLGVLPCAAAQDILGKLKRELRMHAVNSGIAFTIPLALFAIPSKPRPLSFASSPSCRVLRFALSSSSLNFCLLFFCSSIILLILTKKMSLMRGTNNGQFD